MNKTSIEWTDITWNPIRGCSRVSEGCRNCYAEKVAYRFSGAGQPYEGLVRINASGERDPQWNGRVRFADHHLFDPFCWRSPRRIFVNSMSDLFHGNVPDEWIDHIFAVMALCPQHTFQVLTKRPERMRVYFENPEYRAIQIGLAAGNKDGDFVQYIRKLLQNVWLGVSVENQKTADERIPLLLETPASVRFISAEPLLEQIDISEYLRPKCANCNSYIKCGSWEGLDEGIESRTANLICGCRFCCHCSDNRGRHEDHEVHTPNGLGWVIVGGESGPGARPMHPDWARILRDQCRDAEVPFFMKQMGSVFGKNKGKHIPADLDIRQFPTRRNHEHANK